LSNNPDTTNAANTNKTNCLRWLKDRDIAFHQTSQGLYALGDMPKKEEQGGNQHVPIVVSRRKSNGITSTE